MRLRDVREKFGIDSMKKAAELFDIPYTTYQGYELGQREPPFEVLLKMADHFNVSLDYLLGRTHTNTSTPNRTVPVLGVIRAGLPILAEDNWEEQITVGQFEHGADFALRVTGDSMAYAGIREGDYVLLQQTTQASNGQIVAAMVQDGDQLATLKYFINGKPPVLRAANPQYEDQPMTMNHRIIGVYCGLVRNEEPSLREYQIMLNTVKELDSEWEEVVTEATSAGIKAAELKTLLDMMKKTRK